MRGRPGSRSVAAGLGLVLWLGPAVAGALAAPEPREILQRFLRENADVDYQYGECGTRRMDCSCFVQRLFREYFELDLPRTTRQQVHALRYLRVRHIRRPQDVTADRLCVGDLVYTFRGTDWHRGRRHAAVYFGDGEVLHAASSLGGVGLSPVAWLHQFDLQGVYRPLGCGEE